MSLTVALLVPTATTGAVFTTQTTTDAVPVSTATLGPLTDASATLDDAGAATVTWTAPATRPDVDPDYTITRTINGADQTITPDLDTGPTATTFTDDLAEAPTIPVVTAITAGRDHTCAIADDTAYCWGSNSDGRLGNDSTTASPVPVPVDPTWHARCDPLWVLAGPPAEPVCVPGPDVVVTYGLSYTKRGWGPATPTTVTAEPETP